MTAIMRKEDPYWQRPVIYDERLKKKRRLFWDELSPIEREVEMQYHVQQNQRLAREMGYK